jgi:hypothetical protein
MPEIDRPDGQLRLGGDQGRPRAGAMLAGVDPKAHHAHRSVALLDQRVGDLAVLPDEHLLVVPAQLDAGVDDRPSVRAEIHACRVRGRLLRAMDDAGEALVVRGRLRLDLVHVASWRDRGDREEHGCEHGAGDCGQRWDPRGVCREQ